MKTLIIFLFSLTTLFATNWYVRPVTGEYGLEDGTSWDNAFDGFADIAWASVQAGDIVYISGGADSTIYNESLDVNDNGTSTAYITVRKGLDAGHSGRVIIEATSLHSGTGINLNGQSYLHIIGLESRNWWKCIDSDGRSNVHLIDSCTFTNGNWTVGTCTSGNPSDSLIYRWCYVNANWTTTQQTDAFGGTGCTWLEVRNSTIIQSNLYSWSGHSDIMQNRIAGHQLYYNCWFENLPNYDSSAATGLNGQLNLSADTTLFYNCVMVTRGWTYGIFMDQGNTGHTWIMINNTFIKDYNCTDAGTIQSQQIETFAWNNIFYSTNNTNTNLSLVSLSPSYANFDYNLYYQPNNPNEIVNSGSWSYWQGQGGDPNSPDPANPLFTNFTSYPCTVGVYTEDPDFRVQKGSPAINAGTKTAITANDTIDLKAFIESWGLTWADYNGNARDGTTPTIGAFEFMDETDTIPSFSFTAVTNAALNTEYIASSPLTSVDSAYSVWTTSSAQFKINTSGSYSTTQKTANPLDGADTVFVKNTSSGSNSTLTTETILAGGNSQNFNVTTIAIDTIPNAFTFTDLTDVALGSWNEGKIAVAGCDSARFYPASGDSIKLNYNGTYDVAPIWGTVGDTIYAANTASALNSTTTYTTVYSANGTPSDEFSVRTLDAPAVGVIGRLSNGKILRGSNGKVMVVGQ